MPISVTISNLVKYGIQLLILIAFYIYYVASGVDLSPNITLLLFPILVAIMAITGLGLGMITSAMTTKYRDLNVLVGFAVSLLMYISAVPYPVSVAHEKLPAFAANIINYNPLSHILESFRFMVLNTGDFNWMGSLYALVFACIVFVLGLVIFNRTEKSFIDTV